MIRKNNEGICSHNDVLYSPSYHYFCMFICLTFILLVYDSFTEDKKINSSTIVLYSKINPHQLKGEGHHFE